MRLVFLLALGFSTLVAGQEGGKSKAPAAMPTPVPGTTTTVDPPLKVRVDAWWKARETRDHKVMYDLMDAEYRGACTYEAFVTQNVVRTRFDIVSHEVLSAAREANRASVHIAYVAKTPKFGDPTLQLDEPWVQDAKGVWWKYWEPVATPFPTPTPAPGTPRNLPCKAP